MLMVLCLKTLPRREAEYTQRCIIVWGIRGSRPVGPPLSWFQFRLSSFFVIIILKKSFLVWKWKTLISYLFIFQADQTVLVDSKPTILPFISYGAIVSFSSGYLSVKTKDLVVSCHLERKICDISGPGSYFTHVYFLSSIFLFYAWQIMYNKRWMKKWWKVYLSEYVLYPWPIRYSLGQMEQKPLYRN